MKPETLAFKAHTEEGRFQLGLSQSKWGIVSESEGGPAWPFLLVWVSAAAREKGSDKFYFRFEMTNYPSQAPDICIWDKTKNTPLSAEARPKGINDVAMLFRSNWEGGLHLYAPYERHALATHGDWPRTYPSMCWKPADSILKILENIYSTLNSPDYHGI